MASRASPAQPGQPGRWLAGWLAWLVNWLVGWLAGWLAGRSLAQQAPRAFPLTFNKDLMKKREGIGPGSSRSICISFQWRFHKEIQGNWPKKLEEQFPFIFNTDSIRKQRRIWLGSWRSIYHWLLIRIWWRDVRERAQGAPRTFALGTPQTKSLTFLY